MATKKNPFGLTLDPIATSSPWAPSLPAAPKLPPGIGGGSPSLPGLRPPPGSVLNSFNATPAPTAAPPVDYRANILNDPIYQQQMAALSAAGIADAASRKQSIDQALVQFGEIPNWTSAISGLGLNPGSGLFQSLGQDVDAATVRAAQGLTKAGLSTTAKLARGHTTALDSLMSALAARGIVRSGSTGVGTNLENQNYLGAQYDARQQLLQYLNGVQAAWAQAQMNEQQQAAGYLTDAAQRGIAAGGGGSSTTSSSSNSPFSAPYVGPPTGAGGASGVPTPKAKPPAALLNPYTTGQKARG